MRCSRSAGRRGRRGAPSGFTLFEVLAAVLIIGTFFTWIAGAAMQGLRAEGESRRRLEASLLADELLVEIEGDLDQGEVPPVGSSLGEEDPFQVTLDVREIDPGALLPPEALAGAELAAAPGGGSRLRQIDIRVSWSEGDRDLSVLRSTFAFDVSGLVGAGEDAGSLGDGGAGGDREDLTGTQRRLQRLERSGKLQEMLNDRRARGTLMEQVIE